MEEASVSYPLVSLIKTLLNKVTRIASWSFPAKITLTALVGGLGGSSLVGFLSEYATYVYCLSYGIRPPAEGIPYLKATVTAGSIFLLLSGALIFISVTLTFKQLLGYAAFIESSFIKLKSNKNDTLLDKLRNELATPAYNNIRMLSWKKFFLLLSPLTILACWALIYFAIIKTNNEHTVDLFQWHSTFSLSFFAALLIWIPLIIIWRPPILWWLAAIASIINIFFWIALLFTPKHHAELLRAIGYGGGLPISVELKEKSAEPINGLIHLLLRTSSSLIVLDRTQSQIVEIPIEQIAKIRHETGGLYNLQSHLP